MTYQMAKLILSQFMLILVPKSHRECTLEKITAQRSPTINLKEKFLPKKNFFKN